MLILGFVDVRAISAKKQFIFFTSQDCWQENQLVTLYGV